MKLGLPDFSLASLISGHLWHSCFVAY